MEPAGVLVAQLGGRLERRQAGGVQRLVGVGIPHPGHHRLRGESGLELAPVTGQGRLQGSGAEGGVEGVRPQLGHAGDVLHGSHDVGSQSLLGSRLSDVESGAPAQSHPQGERALPRLGRRWRQTVAPPDPPASGQVQDEPQRFGMEEQELPPPADPGDDQPVQGVEGRVEGLEGGEGGQLRPLDHRTSRLVVEESGQRLDLGELGHLATPRSSRNRRRPARWAAARGPQRRTPARPAGSPAGRCGPRGGRGRAARDRC